jgi:ankyrin repeat protein
MRPNFIIPILIKAILKSFNIDRESQIGNHEGSPKLKHHFLWQNMTCMHDAALWREHGVIRILIEAGFNVNTRVILGNPTGFEAASAGSKVQRDSVTKRGLTALHAAAFFGRPNNLRLLLNEGAEVNVPE